MKAIDLDSFSTHLDPETRKYTFTTERSTLGDHLGRVLSVKNSKTNNVADFMHVETVYDNEGDIVCDRFAPSSLTVLDFPKLRGAELVIYND